jgi:hypothetical protein
VRQYVSGLCAATLGLCAAGWLALAPVAFGYRDGAAGPARAALHRALLADRGTAAALAVVSLATLLAWIVAWRRRLRADGVLAGASWREARVLRRRARAEELAAAQEQAAADAVAAADETPDPARVLSELRALLIPLLAESDAAQAARGGDEPAAHQPAVPEPAMHEPVVSEPAAGEPAVREVAVHRATVTEPVANEPASREPAADEPARDQPAGDEPGRDEPVAQGPAIPLPRPGGLAAMESMLAGAELLMVACGEEEAW